MIIIIINSNNAKFAYNMATTRTIMHANNNKQVEYKLFTYNL